MARQLLSSEAGGQEYARVLRDAAAVVEIINTFYQLPKAALLETWRQQVPPGFRFVVKASRRITHIKRLGDAASETEYLCGRLAVSVSSSARSCFSSLLTCGPTCRVSRRSCSCCRPERARPSSFDIRHGTTTLRGGARCARVRALRRRYGRRREPALAETAPFIYLRLRREHYDDAALVRWLDRLRAGHWERAYVFFCCQKMAPSGHAWRRVFGTEQGVSAKL
jgi:uncharacterized protein YecE (DUF72 family)